MVLAFVLGTIIESSTRRSLLIFGGDPTGFVTRPISGTILAIFAALAVLPLVRALIKRRRSGAAGVEAKSGVAEMESHGGAGDVGVAGDDGDGDAVVLPRTRSTCPVSVSE